MSAPFNTKLTRIKILEQFTPMNKAAPAILDQLNVPLMDVIIERRLAAPEQFASFLDCDEVILLIDIQRFQDTFSNGIFDYRLDDGTDNILQILGDGDFKFHICYSSVKFKVFTIASIIPLLIRR